MNDYITYILLAAMITAVIATMIHEDKKEEAKQRKP